MGLLSFLFGSHPQQPNIQDPNNPQAPQLPMSAPVPQGAIQAQAYAPQPQPPQAPPQVAPGSLTQHLATVAPAAPLAAGAAPQPPAGPPPQQGDDITVTGDPWKPHKASVLGQISDYILGTHFGRDNVRKNMEGALQHLQSNPEEAIRRMAEFDPQTAMDLYSKVASEKHWNALAEREGNLTAMQQAKAFMPIAAGMMQRISTDPKTGAPLPNIDPAAWQAARNQLMSIGNHYGMTPEQINDMVPETPDVNVATALAAGQFPVSRQASLAEKTGHDAATVAIGRQNASSNAVRAQAAMIGARTGQANAATNAGRLDETITHDTNEEGLRQEGLNQKPPQMRVQMTKYGPMEITGNSAVLRRPDGTSLRYISTDGVNWVPTHQKPKGK